MDGSECSNIWETFYMAVLAVVFILLITSLFMTLNNQAENKGKYPNAMEIFGILYLFLSDKLLNDSGKKWRPMLLVSLSVFISMIIGVVAFDIC